MHTALSAIEERLDAPTSKGLAHAVSAAIRDGVLGAGDRLPPIRTVAAELALSPTTVSAAWSLLQRSGTVVTDGRRGTTVATDAGRTPVGGSRYRRVVDHEGDFALDLSTGVPDPALLPDLGPALRTVTAALGTGSYLDDPVLPELAALVRRDWPVADAPLTVVDGAMDGLDLVVRTALRFGDRVVVEDPGFPALLDLLEATGVQVVGVPLDTEGVEPGALADALRGGARAVFLQPRAQNPTGVTLTERRAEELAHLLADTECLVVEDDSAYGLSPSPLVSLGRWLPERTVHVRSFSKAYGPDLRLAAVSGPPELLRAVTSRRQLGQGWTSRLLQQVLASLLSSPTSRREVERAASTYAARRDTFVGRLAEHGVVVGGTEGLNAWVPVLDETAAVVRLASQGVAVAPGRPFRTAARGSGAGGHVRVTVGLVDGDVAALADQVAAAARVGDHRGRRAR